MPIDKSIDYSAITPEIKALTKLVIVGAVLTLPVFAVTMLHMANPALVPHWMVRACQVICVWGVFYK